METNRKTRKNGKRISITYGTGSVIIYTRAGGGGFVAAWRENGRRRTSSYNQENLVREFAKRKARELDRASGQQWVTPVRMARLEAMERLAEGEEQFGRLLASLDRCGELMEGIGGLERLEDAVRFFVSHGPATARRSMSMAEVFDALMAEYKQARKITENTMRNEWKKFIDGRESLPLLEVTREMLEAFFDSQKWAARTRRNAQTRWATFFRRSRELEFWPRERPLPTDGMKKPRKAEKAPDVFSVAEGKALLRGVMEHMPRYLSYVLIAGWAGCRPSETVALRWRNLDAAEGVLHLPSDVVGKTARERWIKLDPRLVATLLSLRNNAEDGDRICLTRSREEVSKLARHTLGLRWTPDILRHSFITYRLQVNSNVYEVAEEAGNSPQVIRSNYRRPMPLGLGEKWFDLANC